MIKNKRKTDQCFSFGPVTSGDILEKQNNLDAAKAFQQSDVPTKIPKQNYVCVNINQCISNQI